MWQAAVSVDGNEQQALETLLAQIPQMPAHVFLFISPELSGVRLLDVLRRERPQARFYGASASGVLGPGTIAASGISMLCVPASELQIEAIVFVEPSNQAGWLNIIERLKMAEQRLDLANLSNCQNQGFALLFSAGLLASEERVTSCLHLALPDLPLVGGTASDGLRFIETYVICDGVIHRASNLVLLCRSQRQFKVFQHHHFLPTAQELVVTELGITPRHVLEFNGRPAREELARVLAMPAESLTVPGVSKMPLGIQVHDRWFIRSVMQIGQPELMFACALERGAVLSLMSAGNILQELDQLLANRASLCGGLFFNCLGRFFELQGDNLLAQASSRLDGLTIAGMNTYGEQFMGMHLNHTLTGLMFSA